MLNMPSTAKMTIILALVLTVSAASLLVVASQLVQMFTLRKAVDSPLKSQKLLISSLTSLGGGGGYTFLYIKRPVSYFLFLKFFFLCKSLNIILYLLRQIAIFFVLDYLLL